MLERKINFGAGPAMLPDEVLKQIRDELFCLPSCGNSILEISHRGPAFREILTQAENLLRQLVGIPETHAVLFLQGGSRLQFSVVPINLAIPGKTAGYSITGAWSKMAAEEARKMSAVELVWNGEKDQFSTLPSDDQLRLGEDWSYLYFASNETIHGVQFRPLPVFRRAPLVCDMSSDFLSRPIRVQDFALIFACAQKNAGVAGLTIVIVDRNRLVDCDQSTPGYLNLKNHIQSDNLYNTPPTFAIYVLKLMLEWIQSSFGDLAGAQRQNLAKAAMLYETIDKHADVYRGHAERSARSMANVTFRLPTEADEIRFLEGAARHGMSDLKGHRTLGGVRISLYNAISRKAVLQLVHYMDDFARN